MKDSQSSRTPTQDGVVDDGKGTRNVGKKRQTIVTHIER